MTNYQAGWTFQFGFPPPPQPRLFLVTVRRQDGRTIDVALREDEWRILEARAEAYDRAERERRRAQEEANRWVHPDPKAKTKAVPIARLQVIAGIDDTDPKVLLRRAKRAAHPDLGGSHELFVEVGRLEEELKFMGLI